MTDDIDDLRRRLASSVAQARSDERTPGSGADAILDAFGEAGRSAPLTEREKEAFRRLGVDFDLPAMSDDEWHQWVGAHNAVVRRKGPGVPIGPHEVEDELVRRRVLDKLLNGGGQG